MVLAPLAARAERARRERDPSRLDRGARRGRRGGRALSAAPRAGRVAALLLAAGAARRFGSQKLLHPVRGAALVRRTAESLLGAAVDEVLAVVGSEGDAVAAALAGLPLRVVRADDWAEGMAASLRAGMRALDEGAAAALIALGDQPEVGAAIVDPLVRAWRAGGGPVVAPSFGGVVRPPVLFDRTLFGELLALAGDRGARAVLERDPGRVTLVPLATPEPRDVDSPEDLAQLED